VDDDPDYLSVIEHWLSGTYSVSCFNCGDDLLDGLMAATPDLILLDYEMPEMDGYEIMKAIRNEESTKEIPIIFLTGKNDRDHVYRILEYKPDGYLLKTSRKDTLLDAIHRFFAEAIFKFSSKNALI
jgi:CheY-like chemotaxis protein